jgi:RNA polymerase sigma-70 factor (ECF subfamily)
MSVLADKDPKPSTMTDADRAFFEQEITGLLDRLYGTALRLSKNRADAEDLVAETVTKAWVNFGSLHDRQCFRGWLFRILTNTFLSECRKTTPLSIEALAEAQDETDQEPAFSLFDRLHQPFLLWWGNPEQEFLNKVLQQDLQKAVDALPEVFRVPVILSDLQGLSYQEIAETLGVPVGTVRSRLNRGRSQLQKALWQHAQEAGLKHAPAADKESSHISQTGEHHERH